MHVQSSTPTKGLQRAKNPISHPSSRIIAQPLDTPKRLNQLSMMDSETSEIHSESLEPFPIELTLTVLTCFLPQ